MNASQKKLPKLIAYILQVGMMCLAVLPVYHLLEAVEEKMFSSKCLQISAENNLSFEKIEIGRGRGGQIQTARCRAQPKTETGGIAAPVFDLYPDWLWAINIIRLALVGLYLYVCAVIFRKTGISKYF